MASSWFNGLSSLLSRRNIKKKVSLRQTSKLHRDLYLEPLETRLNPSNFSYSNGNLDIWFHGDPVNTTISVNNNGTSSTASGGSIFFTTNSNTGWINGDPTAALGNKLSVGPPASFTNVGSLLTVRLNDSSFSGLTNIQFRSTQGSTQNIIFGSDQVGSVFVTNLNVNTLVSGTNYTVAPSTGAGTIGITGNAGSGSGASTYAFLGFEVGQTYILSGTTVTPYYSSTRVPPGDTVTINDSSQVLVNGTLRSNTVTPATAVFTSPTEFQILTPGAYHTLRPGGGQIGFTTLTGGGAGYVVGPTPSGNGVGLTLNTGGNTVTGVSGYSNAPSTANGGITIVGNAGTGTGASFTTVLTLDSLVGRNVLSGGANYRVGDKITVPGGAINGDAFFYVDSIVPATGAITGINSDGNPTITGGTNGGLINPGYGYTTLNNLNTISNSLNGTGATISGLGTVGGITAISLGNNYATPVAVTFVPSSGGVTFTTSIVATATAKVSGQITYSGSPTLPATATGLLSFNTAINPVINPNFRGRGYAPGNIVQIDGGGTPALIVVDAIDAVGGISASHFTYGGLDYPTLTSLSTTAQSGTGFGAVVSGTGSLSSITQNLNGTGYSNPVTVTISGGTVAATATVQIDVFGIRSNGLTTNVGVGGYFDPTQAVQGGAYGATGGVVGFAAGNAGGSGYDNPVAINILPQNGGIPATAYTNTVGLDLNAAITASQNIGVKVTPTSGNTFKVTVNGYIQTLGNGAVDINAGTATGSTVSISPGVFNSINNASILTTGSGGISLKATSLTSTVNVNSGNLLWCQATGGITIQGGSNAGGGAGSIIGNGSIIKTNSGDISFPGSSSAVLLSGSGEVFLISKTGNISLSGTLDNLSSSIPTSVRFSTIGSVSIDGFIGVTNGRIGAITLEGDGSQGINNLTFGLLNTSSNIFAQRLTVNGSIDAIRGNVNIYGNQNYANPLVGSRALYLETLSGSAQTVNFAGTVTVVSTSGSLNEAIVYLDGNLNGSLVLAKGLSTTGQLTILDMGAVTVGNVTTSSTVTSGVGTIDFNSPVSLAGNTVFVANNAISFGKAITNSALVSARNLNISTTAAVTFADLGDNIRPLGIVTIDNASSALSILGAASIVNVAGLVTAVRLAGPIDISAPTSQTYRGNVTLRTNNTIKTGNMDLANLGNVVLGTTGQLPLASVLVSTGGSGYTPSSSFTVGMGVAGVGGVVTVATGTATTNSSGAITSIVVSSSGAGYVTGNTYTVTKSLASVSVLTSGSGYTASTTFPVNIGNLGVDGVVTVATGIATTNSSGAITSIVINSAGMGYVTGKTYIVEGGTGTTITTKATVLGTATISPAATVQANSVVVATGGGGAGYTASTTFPVNIGTLGLDGVITVATGTATTNSSGAITSIAITFVGSGYVTGNTYTVEGGTTSTTITTKATVTYTGYNSLGDISILGSVTKILSNFIQEAGTKVLVGSSTGGVIAFSNANGASTGFSFASAVNLVQSMTITGSSGTNISFAGSINSDSITRSMTLSTSNGQISFSGNIGSTISLGTVDISANNSGKIVFNPAVSNIQTSGGFKVTGNAVVQSTTATGITFSETTSDIQFVNDLSGGSNLTSDVTFVTPGNLSFGSFGQGATGVSGSLKKITITGSSNPASFTSGAINAESLTTNVRVAGSFTVSGSQTYTDAGGAVGDNDVFVNAGGNIIMGVITNVDEITLNNSSGAGSITLNNALATGAATFNHGGTLQFNGSSFVAKSFSETSISGGVTLGTGALSAGVTIQVTGTAADILFTRPVLINDAAILKGNGFGSDITFQNTLRSVGNKNLTINGIQGNILFQNNVGDNSQALGNILISSGSPELLQSTGSVLNALSLVVSSSNPIFGNIDFSPTAMIFTGGSGLTLSTNNNGHVLTLSKDSPGTGYVTGDIVSINNGTGATARVTANVITGAITGLELLTAGTGYTNTTGPLGDGLTNIIGSGLGSGGTVFVTANTSSNILLNTVNLSSAGSFVLNSALNDTVQLLGNISNANGVDQNGAIKVTLGSSSISGTFAIGTAGSTGLDFEGDIILQQNSDLTSGGGMRIGGTIDSFSNTDPKSISLKSTSSGLVQTDREIGSINVLKSFTADATNTGFVTIQDTVTSDSIVAVLTQNGITITGSLNLVESETNLVGGSGNIVVSGNISGTAGSDIIFDTSAGTISVNGSSGIGTSTIAMGDVKISNTSSSLSITGAVYAQSLVTDQTLAGQIQVLGSQTITNKVQLLSNAGPILVSNISTTFGDIDLQVSGTGAVTVGALNAGVNTPADITIRHGNTLTFNGSLTGKSFTEVLGSLGVIVISNSVAGTPVTFTVSGTGSGFEFINAVQLKEDLTINSNSKVAFDSTLDTAATATTKNITININVLAIDRDVDFSNKLGSNRILGNIIITGANDIDADTNTISALSLTASAIGSITLLGSQLYSSATGLALTANGDIDVGQITTTNSGSVIFNNKNNLNLLGNIDANGRLTQTDVAGGTTTFVNMGDINSASGSINIQSSGGFAVTFNGNISLLTNTTIQTNGAGAINLGTNSTNTLRRNSGVTSALLLNVNATGTGVVTLNSKIGGGGFELGTLNVSSGQLINIGSQSIVTSSGGQIYSAPTTKLTSGLAITSGPGSILFTGNIEGLSNLSQDLSISNTTGNFTVTGNLGTQSVQLGVISGSGLFSVALGSSFAVNSIRAKSISLTSIVNNIDINTLSQVYQNSVNLDADGNITTGATTSTTGIISLTAAGNITENGLITSGVGGTITLDHGGLLVLAGDVTSTSTFTVISGVNSSINVGTSTGTLATNDPVDITVNSGNFTLGRNVTLVNGLYVKTLANGGNVTFSSLVDSANVTAKNLFIDSKGLVTFSANLGSINRLGTIVINGTSGYQLTGLTAGGTITAGSLSSGVVANDINLTFDQDYNLGGLNGGLNLTTTTSVAKIGDINIGNLVTTNGAGLTLKNSGAVTFASSITIDGAIAQTSGVTGSAVGAIPAVPQVIFGSTIGNIVTLTSNTAGISFGSKATMLQDTNLIGGTNGNVVFTGNLDSDSIARSLVVTTKGTTDSTTFNGTVGATLGLGSIVVNSKTITVNGGVKTLNSGGQIYNGSLSLGSGTQNLVADGGGSLDFRNNVNGPGNLTMTTSSNISFANNIGNSSSLGAILITGATPTSLNVTGTVLAQSLKTVSSVNGTINIAGNQTYTGVGGLLLSTLGLGDITVGQITSQNAASTIQLDHTGNLNLRGDIYDSGAFNQNSLGSGSIFIGVANTPLVTRNIQVANSDIDFDASVILNSNLSILTAKAAAAVTFNKVINSATLANPVNLKVTSTGKLTFVDSIGDTNPLGAIDTSNASLAGIDANGILTNPNAVIRALSFTSGNVSGDVNILTPQFYNSAAGLNLGTTGVGNDIILGAINTTNSGIVKILNSAALKLQGILVLDGTFTQTSSDTVNADVEIGSTGNSFSLTTNQKNISFQAPITLIANGVFATGGNGNVTFSGKIDSSSLAGTSQAKSLTVTNTTGIVTLGNSVGTGVNSQLGAINLTSGSIILGGASLGTINLNTIGSNGQKFNGPISLDSNSVLDASGTGSVLISSTLNSGQFSNKSLTINNTLGVQVNNRIGGSSALSALNITANSTVLNTDSVKTSGAGQIYNTILTLGNNAITLSADTGLVQFGLSVDIGTQNMTVSADQIEITSTASIKSTNSILTLQPGTLFRDVEIGANVTSAASLSLTAAELGRLTDGFAGITIGRVDSKSNLVVAGPLTTGQVKDPFTLTTGGNLNILNDIAATNNASLSLIDPTGTINLNSTISTEGQSILVNGTTQIGVSGGNIFTTGNSNSFPTGGNITLTSTAGSVVGNGLLILDSGTSGTITSSSTILMSGGITITNSGGATFNSPVTVGSVNINGSTSGKDVTFNGALNATTFNTASAGFNLKLLSGGSVSGATSLTNTGTITLGDNTSDTLTFAGGLTATSSSQLNLAGTIATTNTNMTLGNSVLTTSATLRSGSGIITIAGTVSGGANIKLSLQNNSATGAVNLGGNVLLNQIETFAGNYALNFTGSNNLISGASTTLNNTGGITFGDSTSDISTFTNGLTAIASAVNLAGTVVTTNSAMNLGAVNLSGNGTVKSGTGIITIASVSGANKLSLQDNSSNSRGLVVVNGTVNIGQIETFAQNYAVSLLGSNVAVSSASTFNNTGTTTFGDGGTGVDTITFTGGLTAKAGPITLNSTLASVNSLLDIGTVTLAGNSTLQSGTGTITVGTITDGANSYTLSLQNGTGNQGSVVFSGDVTISAINTANGNYAVSFQNNTTVDSAANFTNLAGVSFGRNASSLTTFTNGVTATAGTGNFVLAGTLKTAGQPIKLGNSVSSINLVDSTIIDSGNSSSATIKIDSLISTNGRSLTLSSGSTTGGTILVNAVDSTAGGLTIANAGGLVTFAGNVGAATGSGLITITNSQQGVEFQGQLFGSNVNIVNTAASKTIKFGGNLTLTGSILTTQQNYNVDISGATNVIGAANNFNNLGNVNINSASGSTTFTNGFGAAFPAAVNVQGTIIANGQVNISKPVNVNGATTTTFNNTSNTISGVVTGSAAITSNGIGTLSLTGNSTGYTGTINANAGNVAVNANFSNASANVGAAGKISGIGSIGTLTANGGVVSPGNSPGTLTVGTATLGNSGSQATYNVEINGASSGQFDQIKVNTSATLANAVLNITAGGNLQVGQQFQIVSGTTTGQFSNAVSSIVAGNTTFSVTYNANGVLLTVTSVTPSPTPTPTPSPTPTPTPSPTPAPTPTPPAPSPTPTPTPTGPYVLFAVGAGAGGGPEVKVNFTDGSSVSFFAYDMAYRGGVRVTMGDLNGDGNNEIICGTGPGGGPNVRVFTVTSSGSVTMVSNFFAFEPQFTGGIYVAAGNLNGDVSGSGTGIADLIVSAGPGGGPRVIAYAGGANYVNLNNQLCDYFVYAPTFSGGVTVAAGNVVGAANSTDEIITGAGAGGGPHVRAFQLSNTNTPNSVLEYMAFDPAIRNGIFVGAGDLDNDGYDEIFASTNSSPSLPTMVNVRYGNGNQAVVYPFGTFTGGATVGVAKDNNNPSNQYMTVGAGPGGGPLVQIYNRNLIAIDSLFAFPINFTGGVFVSTSIS